MVEIKHFTLIKFFDHFDFTKVGSVGNCSFTVCSGHFILRFGDLYVNVFNVNTSKPCEATTSVTD